MNFKNLEKNNFEKNGIEKWIDGENLFDIFLIYFFKKFMITKQQKIDAIYKKIARKDLDFWCIVESKWGQSVFLADRNRREIFRTNYRIVDFIGQDEPMKIIGHPVMIGNVLDYFWNKKWLMTLDRILRFWEEKTKTIEDQSDECIDFIYNLLSK